MFNFQASSYGFTPSERAADARLRRAAAGSEKENRRGELRVTRYPTYGNHFLGVAAPSDYYERHSVCASYTPFRCSHLQRFLALRCSRVRWMRTDCAAVMYTKLPRRAQEKQRQNREKETHRHARRMKQWTDAARKEPRGVNRARGFGLVYTRGSIARDRLATRDNTPSSRGID